MQIVGNCIAGRQSIILILIIQLSLKWQNEKVDDEGRGGTPF